MTDHSPFHMLARTFALALLPLAGLLAAPARAAVTPAELPPVDSVFVLSAEATAPDRITIRWKIADGYYLYRHRTSVQADAGFAAKALQLPKGHAYNDEFFGAVETYRDELVATLPGQARAAQTTLRIKYHGCADVGVCYPPQTRTLTVALGKGGAPAGSAGAAPAAGTGEPIVAFGNASGVSRGSLFGDVDARGALPLPPEQAFAFDAIARDGNTVLLRFTPARGYYLYRDKTRLTLDAAATGAGFALDAPRWPSGSTYEDEYFGKTVVYFDQIEVPVPVRRSRGDARELQLSATFQGCQTNGICYPPMTRTVSMALPRGKVTPAATTAPGTTVGASAPPATAAGDSTRFAPATTAPTATDAGAALTGATTTDAAAIGSGATTAASTAEGGGGRFAGTPRGANLSLVSALLLALAGGLILNLMPCVLPVLSLKALSLAGNGQDPARARRHALWYTAGVMLSFALLGGLALALRQAGLALGWGFQLQQPLVVALLALLMFGLGLSLSGVWHVGGRWTGAGHALTTQSGPAGDFFTGVLAVVVATPCTAPFMGAALAWAFTASAPVALAVFLMLGLGLALPFLLIGFIPALAHRLPRPGAWMETFKQVLAFPLYATAAWLAWVLARQRGADAIGWWLLAAILLAFAAWAWTRARNTGHRWATVAATLAVIALLWPLKVIHSLPRPQAAHTLAAPAEGITPVPFSEERLAALRASHRVVFVNMTADWCVTCKANEKAVFNGAGFRQAMAEANAVYMVGDWTDVDPALTAFLQRYKAVGVPLYVVFPRGGGEGAVLPTVLTAATVTEALKAAAGAAP